ncbi:general substrate transporter [Echria macrotheca]|uniref:General substrate transporter n=1 Tax=Echria macrotheca TaxID=438768 RepID=A0AAJ0F6L2_9PEZI|nr:general substrate transporter [Echria macrotheca]
MDSDDEDRLSFEGQPLLADDDGRDSDATLAPAEFLSHFQAQKPKTIVTLLAVLLFTVTTSGMLVLVPIFRLVEDAACHRYYGKPPDEKIDEHLCKVDDVQRPLAYFGGLSAMLSSIVSLLAALPYGVLADRIGRKPSFVLSYVGILLAFAWTPFMLGIVQTTNLYILMLGSLWFLIGGGIPVAMNSLHAMAADVSSELEKATSFLYLAFGSTSGTLIGPFVAGLLMETISPWFPILSVFVVTPFVFLLLLFLPETLAVKLKDDQDVQTPPSPKKSFKAAIDELLVSLGLLKNSNILLTMVTFFIQPALFAAYSSTLGQYVSKYFGWTLAQTSYLLAPPLNIVHLLVLILVPWVSGLLTSPLGRFQLSVFDKNLALTKVSLVILIVAALLEGFSHEAVLFITGLVVGTFGSAHGPLLRAVATAYVEPNQTSRLYSLISVMETSGAVIGGPVLAKCFAIGLEKRGLWVGLPWFYVAGLVSVALLAMMFVRRAQHSPAETESGLGYQSAEEP